jgi:Zn finger protein HypA/HybF involved in hydrogenase expression
MVKICKNCQKEFQALQNINGKKIFLYKRKFCLTCSPFKSHNTSSNIQTSSKSFIYKLTSEEFKKEILKCKSRQEFFRRQSHRASGSSFKILNRRIKEENIDISHFKQPQSFIKPRYAYSEILTENSIYNNTNNLKQRLIKDNLINYKCAICQNNGIHFNKPLILQLDHINGIRNDNRIENLRLLCPNCHSQTNTFSRGSKRIKYAFLCDLCKETKRSKNSKFCFKCSSKIPKVPSKIKISNEELQGLLYKKCLNKISKELNISFTGLKKHCIKNNIKYKGVQHEGGAVGLHPKG